MVPTTNGGLEEFAHRLLDRLAAGWNEADAVADQCREWLKRQGMK